MMRVTLLLLTVVASCSAFAPSCFPTAAASTMGGGMGLAPPLRTSSLLPTSQDPRGCRRAAPCTLMMAAKKTFKSMDDMIENSDVPILVDFYATWCGPCVIMSRELAALSNDDEIKDKLSIVKIDTEKYPAIASKYDISALPTCVLFKGGKIAQRFEGVMMKDQLKKTLLPSL